MDNQELIALASRLSPSQFESLLEHKPAPIGIGGWLAFFYFQNLVSIPYVAAGLLRQRIPGYILVNLLSLSVIVLVLILLWKRSLLFFAALYTEFALRVGIALNEVRIHLVFVHHHHYTLSGNRSYIVLAAAVLSISLWLAYFKRSKRVLATFGRNL
jgi:hypothetical protein